MSHAVFQTLHSPMLPPLSQKLKKKKINFKKSPVIKNSLSSSSSQSPSSSQSQSLSLGVDQGLLERCYVSSPTTPSCFAASVGGPSPSPSRKDSGTLLQRSKPSVDTSTLPRRSPPAPQLETGGGGGGNIGKIIHFGGGDGGDDGGDDDDYFDDFDDDEGDEGGLFRKRLIFRELFDRKFVDSVLNEWHKTMLDLPAGFRQAYEMGLVSSAQMVKFLAMHARPTTARAISRALPQGISRAFIGRMIADPAFLYKLLLEQAATIGCSLWWEIKNRKDRLKDEWDLALINVLAAAACNAAVVWTLAPCRSYGSTFRTDWQNSLQKLPNNIFENSYPLREFDMQKRTASFLFKMMELCLVGLGVGVVQGTLSDICANKKGRRLSVTVPSVRNNPLATGAFLGFSANLRYQLLCGLDKGLTNYFDVLGVSLFLSTAMRILNVQMGETSRLAWLGIGPNPLFRSDNLMNAYDGPPESSASKQDSSWFISKNTIVSGLGLGLQQGNGDSTSNSDPPKPRRRRVVRKKVTTAA